jgi:ketosteroid isomerase-like protein
MRISKILIAALALGGCAKPAAAPMAAEAVDVAAVQAAVDGVRNAYIAAERAGDAAAIAALYFPNGAIDVFGAPAMRGTEAITAGMAAVYAGGKPELVEVMPMPVNARSNADASELGTYHNILPVNGKRTHEWGRYLVAVSKDSSGTWKVSYLMAFADSTKAEK